MDKKNSEHLATLFRKKITPQAYKKFMKHWGIESLESLDYWAILPDYVIARCPICGRPFTQALDLYSLYLWNNRHHPNSVSYARNGYKRCQHFVGVHAFLNFNGRLPSNSEFDSGLFFSSEPEVPFVSPHLLPDDIEAYAVMHALPICQPWGKQFRPHYTLFTITYYSIDPDMLKFRRMLTWTHGEEIDVPHTKSQRIMTYWEEANKFPETWDLPLWVRNGKLCWLNIEIPELPLNNAKDPFPYQNIEGKRTGYRYQNKSYEIVRTHPTIEEFKDILARYG